MWQRGKISNEACIKSHGAVCEKKQTFGILWKKVGVGGEINPGKIIFQITRASYEKRSAHCLEGTSRDSWRMILSLTACDPCTLVLSLLITNPAFDKAIKTANTTGNKRLNKNGTQEKMEMRPIAKWYFDQEHLPSAI